LHVPSDDEMHLVNTKTTEDEASIGFREKRQFRSPVMRYPVPRYSVGSPYEYGSLVNPIPRSMPRNSDDDGYKPHITVNIETEKRTGIPSSTTSTPRDSPNHILSKRQLFSMVSLVSPMEALKKLHSMSKARIDTGKAKSNVPKKQKRQVSVEEDNIEIPFQAEHHLGVINSKHVNENIEPGGKREQILRIQKRQIGRPFIMEPPEVRATVHGTKAEKNPILQLLRAAAGTKSQKILGLNSKSFDIFPGPLPDDSPPENNNLAKVSTEPPREAPPENSVDQQIYERFGGGSKKAKPQHIYLNPKQSIRQESIRPVQYFSRPQRIPMQQAQQAPQQQSAEQFLQQEQFAMQQQELRQRQLADPRIGLRPQPQEIQAIEGQQQQQQLQLAPAQDISQGETAQEASQDANAAQAAQIEQERQAEEQAWMQQQQQAGSRGQVMLPNGQIVAQEPSVPMQRESMALPEQVQQLQEQEQEQQQEQAQMQQMQPVQMLQQGQMVSGQPGAEQQVMEAPEEMQMVAPQSQQPVEMSSQVETGQTRSIPGNLRGVAVARPAMGSRRQEMGPQEMMPEDAPSQMMNALEQSMQDENRMKEISASQDMQRQEELEALRQQENSQIVEQQQEINQLSQLKANADMKKAEQAEQLRQMRQENAALRGEIQKVEMTRRIPVVPIVRQQQIRRIQNVPIGMTLPYMNDETRRELQLAQRQLPIMQQMRAPIIRSPFAMLGRRSPLTPIHIKAPPTVHIAPTQVDPSVPRTISYDEPQPRFIRPAAPVAPQFDDDDDYKPEVHVHIQTEKKDTIAGGKGSRAHLKSKKKAESKKSDELDTTKATVPHDVKSTSAATVPHDVKSALAATLSHNVKSTVADTVPRDVKTAMAATLPHDIKSAVGATVSHNVKSTVTNTVPHDVNAAMVATVPHVAKSTVAATTSHEITVASVKAVAIKKSVAKKSDPKTTKKKTAAS